MVLVRWSSTKGAGVGASSLYSLTSRELENTDDEYPRYLWANRLIVYTI